MKLLIIGGTRNIGYFLTNRLLETGHHITLLNRGMSQDDLPTHIPRLRCDRTDSRQMRRALAGRDFDAVIDNTIYCGDEAEAVVDIFSGHVGRYIFISTGQVYLVRENLRRPFREEDYDGSLIARPQPNTYDYEEWLYGMDKRVVEDVMSRAYEERNFPYTALRLPMVNSERDHFHRLYNYILRIKDGGPVLLPDQPNYPLRHIYVADVVEAIMHLLVADTGRGRAYNISQEETVSIEAFLTLLAEIMGSSIEMLKVERRMLEANGFLPDISPFSEMWMSELDNTRSKIELDMTYTPLPIYLQRIVAYYDRNPPSSPVGYRRRRAEVQLAGTLG